MTRKSQVNIVLLNAPPALKKRLKLESLKQGRPTSEIAFEILDKNLPGYEEFVENETAKKEVDGQHTPLNGSVQTQKSLLTR